MNMERVAMADRADNLAHCEQVARTLTPLRLRGSAGRELLHQARDRLGSRACSFRSIAIAASVRRGLFSDLTSSI